jgi:hypothetical protein
VLPSARFAGEGDRRRRCFLLQSVAAADGLGDESMQPEVRTSVSSSATVQISLFWCHQQVRRSRERSEEGWLEYREEEKQSTHRA